MNTPAHLIFGIAAFARPAQRATIWAAALGAVAPDLSLYVMAGVSLFILQIPPSVVFDQLYFSDAWQLVFAIDNSAILWGAAVLFGLVRKKPIILAFAAAGLLHIALDFPLHHDDGRAHFWPMTRWVFESPVSYWDHRHHADIVGPIELGLSVVLGVWAAWRIPVLGWRILLGLMIAAELWIVRIWFTMLF